MYKQEIDDLIREWFVIRRDLDCQMSQMPITLLEYIKLRSPDGSAKFIKDEDWELIKAQREKQNRVDVKLESIEEDFK